MVLGALLLFSAWNTKSDAPVVIPEWFENVESGGTGEGEELSEMAAFSDDPKVREKYEALQQAAAEEQKRYDAVLARRAMMRTISIAGSMVLIAAGAVLYAMAVLKEQR